MKVAYFAESPADQAALKIITEAIVGKQTESVVHAGLRHRGWPAVRIALRSVFLELHYQTDAEGLVLIVDSNGSPSHSRAHESPNSNDPKCRLCQLRQIVDEARQHARPRQHGAALKIALGLAVPAIEAWLLCGVDPKVSEAAWTNGLKNKQAPYTKQHLKERLYGTSRPSLSVETEAMTRAASRLAGDFKGINSLFPEGFGSLFQTLKGW